MALRNVGWEMRCDHCGSWSWPEDDWIIRGSTREAVIKIARERGWKGRNGWWYCADCWRRKTGTTEKTYYYETR